jgi:Holliday junction resolvasome RuvABC DNA-binding subunit
MELKGKLEAPGDVGKEFMPFLGRGKANNPRTEAFDAMLSLGYAEKQVGAALVRVESVIEIDAPAEEWIKKALQVI